MDIIIGPAPKLHHDVTGEGCYRNIADRFLVGRVELDSSWKEFAQQRLQDIADHPTRYSLKAGEISDAPAPNGEDGLDAIAQALASLQVDTELPHVFDSQVLLCNGAIFHHDLHGWDNSLFLNWYMAGPPRDFVVAGIGRVTLHPGDVILFDPSRPHALLRTGKPRFSRSGWNEGVNEMSVFLSADIALTPELDTLFGIRRAKKATHESRGSIDVETLVINKYTGEVTPPRARRAVNQLAAI